MPKTDQTTSDAKCIADARELIGKTNNPASRGVVALKRHYVTLRYSNVIVLGHCPLV